MIRIKHVTAAVAIAAAGTLVTAGTADAKKSKPSNCVLKAAQGTGSDAEAAKFQVDEALLQAVDWGAWASWMATKTTPGYDFGKRTYKCKPGGIGVTCVGQAKICKLG